MSLIVFFCVSLLKACALQFLHERNISHLDLKPQNILLCGSVLKLAGDLNSDGFRRVGFRTAGAELRITDRMAPNCVSSWCVFDFVCSDFGFAQYMSPWDEHSVLRGSPLYMAPEMVCRRQYDSRVDLWSVGVILYGERFSTFSKHQLTPVRVCHQYR